MVLIGMPALKSRVSKGKTSSAIARSSNNLLVRRFGRILDPSVLPAPMLIIRNIQIETLARVLHRRRRAWILAQLEQRGFDQPEALVAQALPLADALTIAGESDLLRLILAMYRFTEGQLSLDFLPKEARNLLLAFGESAADRLSRFEAWGELYEQTYLSSSERVSVLQEEEQTA